MHCQTLLPGKSGIVIKEDPESQYHLLQGSSGLFSVLTADGRPIRHYLWMYNLCTVTTDGRLPGVGPGSPCRFVMWVWHRPLPRPKPAPGCIAFQEKQKNQHN